MPHPATGNSIYPIEPGAVFKLDKIWTRHNPKAGAVIDHTAFIWIQRAGRLTKQGGLKRQAIHAFFCFVPTSKDLVHYTFYWARKVNRDYIANRYLRDGYEQLSADLKFYYHKSCYTRFYRLIGRIP